MPKKQKERDKTRERIFDLKNDQGLFGRDPAQRNLVVSGYWRSPKVQLTLRFFTFDPCACIVDIGNLARSYPPAGVVKIRKIPTQAGRNQYSRDRAADD